MSESLTNLKLVRLGRPVSRPELEALGERILEAFVGAVRRIQILDREPPGVDEIEAPLLTGVLAQDVGGHVLAITDTDLTDAGGPDFFRFMFGCKDNRSDVAVVSTRRLKSADPGRSIARLLKVGLHELGHNFGLVHHYGFAPADGGGYCPMTKGDYNRHGERSYVRSIIDGRAAQFCRECRRVLYLAHPW
ncbi:MAG: hypothetical protein R3244_13615 [Thermoanaerobaculia bacterium]|nr:hypothetical protein [Thermoanaerobaculia bacterium]